MKVVFLSRSGIRGLVSMVVLLACFIGLSLVYLNQTSVATKLNEPVYQGNTGKKMVAITVNVDWGEEYIPRMLEEFKKNDAVVTFYVTGKWAEKNSELLKQMAQAGHSVQNHGYSHLHFNNLARQDVAEQIKKAESIINKTTGKNPAYFAPPYGEQNRQVVSVASELGYTLTMWSVDTIDWQRPSSDVIVKRVLNQVHNDAIILMHPTAPTVKALPEMLGGLREEGYKMVAIEQIITNPKNEAQPDVKNR